MATRAIKLTVAFGALVLGYSAAAGETGKAQDTALGTLEEPVKADMPRGQRAYLERLRCSDGSAPSYQRTGNLGPGKDGHIIDNYEVDCGAAEPGKTNIIMDMYHRRHREKRAVHGFTIVEP